MFRRFVQLLCAAVLLAAVVCDRLVAKSADGRVYENIELIPQGSTAVVLGTSKLFHGRPNAFYEARLRAALELFRAGKLQRIVLSGAGRSAEGNEPDQMRLDLIDRGVPAEMLLLDLDGTRTIASVVNTEKTLHIDKPIFVSQRFHIERAIYLARGLGSDAAGYAADDAPSPWRELVRTRELLSRVAAVAERFHGTPLYVRQGGQEQ